MGADTGVLSELAEAFESVGLNPALAETVNVERFTLGGRLNVGAVERFASSLGVLAPLSPARRAEMEGGDQLVASLSAATAPVGLEEQLTAAVNDGHAQGA